MLTNLGITQLFVSFAESDLRKESSHLLLTRQLCLAWLVCVLPIYEPEIQTEKETSQSLSQIHFSLYEVRGMGGVLPCCRQSQNKRHEKTLYSFFSSFSFFPLLENSTHMLQPVLLLPWICSKPHVRKAAKVKQLSLLGSHLTPGCSSQHDIIGHQAFRESVQSTEKG